MQEPQKGASVDLIKNSKPKNWVSGLEKILCPNPHAQEPWGTTSKNLVSVVTIFGQKFQML